MNLAILSDDELPRFENEPGYAEECAKRFEALQRDAETFGAVVEAGLDVEQPYDELKEEVERLLEKAEALRDVTEDLIKEQIEGHADYYQSGAYLDQCFFENIFSHLSYHSGHFDKYLQDNDLPEALAYEIKEGIAKNDIKGHWKIANFNTIENTVVSFEALGYFQEEPSETLRDALRHFEEKDFPVFIDDDKNLVVDLSDHYPCYCIDPENIRKYLEEHYRGEYDRLRAKRA